MIDSRSKLMKYKTLFLMNKAIKKFLGMREKGNPYGCKFFANIGCYSFVIFILLAVTSPCMFSMSSGDWCRETFYKKTNK